jgi:hypothetical protein
VSPAQRTAEARTAFTASLHSAASNLGADLQSRAKNIHANAKALQKQQGDVEKEVKGLRRKNDELEKEVGRWDREWSREVEKMGFGRVDGSRGSEAAAAEEEQAGVGELDLEGIERDLGTLEEWVKIVEEEEEEEEEGQGEGEGEGVVDKGKKDGVEDARSASSKQSKAKGTTARETRTGTSAVK